jgi:predicted rRNA methylase YqxC with S4 and FtsJ domains
VIDVSFISLRLVLPPVVRLLRPGAWVVALIKPQFEAGRAEADRGAGVISDPTVHRAVLRQLAAWVADWPQRGGPLLRACGLAGSPIRGREGNHEYLLQLVRPAVTADAPEGSTADAAAKGVDDAAIDRLVAEIVWTNDERSRHAQG